jgi:hypothetical protein
MAIPRNEIKQVPNGFQPVVYVEYPPTSALSISPERYLTSTKRVDLAKGVVVPTREQAEGQFPILYKAYNIKR